MLTRVDSVKSINRTWRRRCDGGGGAVEEDGGGGGGAVEEGDGGGGWVMEKHGSSKREGLGEVPTTRVNLVEFGDTGDGIPKVVPLTTVGDLHKLINDIEAGKHDELLFGMTNDDRMETMDALGTICKSIQADNNNVDVIPCKVSHVDDLINRIVDESTILGDPIVQSVNTNTKSTSYAGAAGASAKD
ncbi:hypothetical protein Tco_0945815 [Tanacetum coccineum]